MKRKKLISFCVGAGLTLSILLMGCSAGQPAQSPSLASQPPADSGTTYQWEFVKKSTGIDNLKAECDQKGTVVSLDYETPLYATDPETIVTKTLYIYLPYGYDEAQPYNILYLLHGGGESAEYWIAGERWGPTTRNVLDNMIKNGVCEPFIVVTPTFYAPVNGSEGESDSEAEPVSEDEENRQIVEPGNPDTMDMTLPITFANELRLNIIPAVESTYSTYANGDTSEGSLVASRDHRAFAGFSMGSMTSIRSALMQNLDLFSWIGSYSGAATDVSDFKTALESDECKDLPIKFWFNGNGKGDLAHDEHDEFCHGVLEAMPERFVDGQNFAWIDLRDGSHSYASWVAQLYNCMLVFFK